VAKPLAKTAFRAPHKISMNGEENSESGSKRKYETKNQRKRIYRKPISGTSKMKISSRTAKGQKRGYVVFRAFTRPAGLKAARHGGEGRMREKKKIFRARRNKNRR